MNLHHFKSYIKKNNYLFLMIGFLVLLLATSVFAWQKSEILHTNQTSQLVLEKENLLEQLEKVSSQLNILENEDQKIRNNSLQLQLEELKIANADAVKQYERILSVQEDGAQTDEAEEKWALILSTLSKNEYASASALLSELSKDITEIEKKLAQEAALNIPKAIVNNQAPSAGFQQQRVETSVGQIVVSLVAGDLNSTRVIVDTASDSDCKNDCPVLSLGDYVARNGAFAGINGSYFCPASYPTCSDKKNTYDLLVMNKNKTYFNSDNNVYSTNPAVIFHGGSVSFVGAASQWGRDTGIDSMLSNFPLLLSGNEIRFGGDDDPKKGSRGNRSFVANKGNIVYIGVVHGATVAEAAIVLKTLGMDNALNLDSGGSTALWANGYRVGPGRAIPNAILFVRK